MNCISSFFNVIRENIKNIPGYKLDTSNVLIETLTNILNLSLRKHLTKWQAKFRRWYEFEIKKPENDSFSPQEIQQKFPEYKDLISDLNETIQQMIVLKKELYVIAFNKKEIN